MKFFGSRLGVNDFGDLIGKNVVTTAGTPPEQILREIVERVPVPV